MCNTAQTFTNQLNSTPYQNRAMRAALLSALKAHKRQCPKCQPVTRPRCSCGAPGMVATVKGFKCLECVFHSVNSKEATMNDGAAGGRVPDGVVGG